MDLSVAKEILNKRQIEASDASESYVQAKRVCIEKALEVKNAEYQLEFARKASEKAQQDAVHAEEKMTIAVRQVIGAKARVSIFMNRENNEGIHVEP